MKRNKETDALEKIVAYCDKIIALRESRLTCWEEFAADDIARDAATLYIFQIGELAGKLSSELREKHPEVPWRNVRGIRNIIAHAYEDVDPAILWEVVYGDIPDLRSKCLNILDS